MTSSLAPWRPVVAAVFILHALAVVAPGEAQTRRVVHITAERFIFTPSQIVLEQGEEVDLRLKSDDTAHGFRILGTGINVAIPKRGRQELSVIFCPKERGRYEFECTRMCGAGHNFMRGVLIVRERADRATK